MLYKLVLDELKKVRPSVQIRIPKMENFVGLKFIMVFNTYLNTFMKKIH